MGPHNLYGFRYLESASPIDALVDPAALELAIPMYRLVFGVLGDDPGSKRGSIYAFLSAVLTRAKTIARLPPSAGKNAIYADLKTAVEVGIELAAKIRREMLSMPIHRACRPAELFQAGGEADAAFLKIDEDLKEAANQIRLKQRGLDAGSSAFNCHSPPREDRRQLELKRRRDDNDYEYSPNSGGYQRSQPNFGALSQKFGVAFNNSTNILVYGDRAAVKLPGVQIQDGKLSKGGVRLGCAGGYHQSSCDLWCTNAAACRAAVARGEKPHAKAEGVQAVEVDDVPAWKGDAGKTASGWSYVTKPRSSPNASPNHQGGRASARGRAGGRSFAKGSGKGRGRAGRGRQGFGRQ